MSLITEHPFKQGVRRILKQHFPDEIANRFKLVFETESYTDDVLSIWKQKKTDTLIMQVFYDENDLSTYICDIFSWMSPKQSEYKLLRYITDKFKAGEIGKNWVFQKNSISKDFKSGKYETPLEPDEVVEAKKKEVNKLEF
jgi:hypothetical protein